MTQQRERISGAKARPTIGEAGAMFLSYCRSKNLADTSVMFYKKRLKFFGQWLDAQGFGEIEIQEVKAPMLRDFLTYEMQRTSPATAKHARRTLSAMFGFLVTEEIVAVSPMSKVPSPRVQENLIEPLTDAEIESLILACPKTFTGRRNRAILLVLLDCGLRVAELCSLNLDDVSFADGTLKVQRKGGRWQQLPFGQSVARGLRDYLIRRGDLDGEEAVFVSNRGSRLSVRQVGASLQRLGQKVGVKLHPHKMRHTFAVSFLKNGGDAFVLQAALGHSDLAMTRRYCNIANADLLSMHRKVSPADKFAALVKPTRISEL